MGILRHGLKALLTTAVLLATVLPAAADKDKGLTIDIDGEDDANLSISLSGDWATSFVEGLMDADIECDGDLDAETEAMLRHLKRKGPGSKYKLEDDDQTIRARRRKGSWEMDIAKDDGSKARVVLPWALAECMLGDERAMERYRGEGDIALTIEDDGVVTIRIE